MEVISRYQNTHVYPSYPSMCLRWLGRATSNDYIFPKHEDLMINYHTVSMLERIKKSPLETKSDYQWPDLSHYKDYY